MKTHIPRVKKPAYNVERPGVAGEIGTGDYGVRYIQTAIPINEIDSLTLVADLRDSERWHVRQLFQRDVDTDRVQKEIVPYFKNPQKIKFFNPLTIVLMPMDRDGQVLPGVKEVRSIPDPKEGFKGVTLEAEGHYKLSWPESGNPFGVLEYNSNLVKLVAVDGQHRLQALKDLATEREHIANLPDSSFDKVKFDAWRIPIVLLVFPPITREKKAIRYHFLLENMRDIFITINTTAQKPNRCREILLTDSSVTAICCQELLDYCHQPKNEVPLMFFDWRAHDRSEDNFYPQNPQAYLRVEELEDYHINYLIGESEGQFLSQDQRDSLLLGALNEEVNEGDAAKLREDVRQQYRATILPGVIHMFSTFKLFAEYVRFLKKLQASCSTMIMKHALDELLYGRHHGAKVYEPAITKQVDTFKKQCEDEKELLPELFKKIIGGRGIFCGLKLAKKSKEEVMKTTYSWKEAAEWYVQHMNTANKDGYFDYNQNLLRHIAVDHNGNIVNYRLAQQEDAFGRYCALLACAFSKEKAKFAEEINDHLDKLHDTIHKGFKRELRPQIRDANLTKDRAFVNKLVEKKAGERTNAQITRLKAALSLRNS